MRHARQHGTGRHSRGLEEEHDNDYYELVVHDCTFLQWLYWYFCVLYMYVCVFFIVSLVLW